MQKSRPHSNNYTPVDCTAILKDAGMPRNTEIYENYKIAPKNFRSSRRRAEAQYERDKIDQICESKEMDQTYFWFLVNKHKPKKSTKTHPLKIGKRTIADPNEKRSLWKDYFEKLYTPSSQINYNDEFKNHAEI